MIVAKRYSGDVRAFASRFAAEIMAMGVQLHLTIASDQLDQNRRPQKGIVVH